LKGECPRNRKGKKHRYRLEGRKSRRRWEPYRHSEGGSLVKSKREEGHEGGTVLKHTADALSRLGNGES